MPKRIPTYRPKPMQTEKERHREFKRTRKDKERNALYSSRPWRAFRLSILAERPLCEECDKQGTTTAATRVDHIEEVKDKPELTYDPSNVRPLCESCHNAKTGRNVMRKRYA